MDLLDFILSLEEVRKSRRLLRRLVRRRRLSRVLSRMEFWDIGKILLAFEILKRSGCAENTPSLGTDGRFLTHWMQSLPLIFDRYHVHEQAQSRRYGYVYYGHRTCTQNEAACGGDGNHHKHYTTSYRRMASPSDMVVCAKRQCLPSRERQS